MTISKQAHLTNNKMVRAIILQYDFVQESE